jgi:dimethylhistidine N-methyltransferase
MELDTLTTLRHPRLKVKISRRDKSVDSFAKDVVAGLSSNPKTLPPKYFYDHIGSKLFEAICDLPEYYVTRTEFSILQNFADDIAGQFDDNVTIVELGSGNSSKTRLLIEALIRQKGKLHYLPVDISKSILMETSHALLSSYRQLRVSAYISEYFTALRHLQQETFESKLILFLGSNIGNFEPEAAVDFLKKTYATMQESDRLLMGADLMKDKSIVEPAYDDSQGITAQFNMNLLTRMNRDLGGNFDLSQFRHKAFLNETLGRVEMHVESLRQQAVTLHQLKREFFFEKGETIHTENSYKFTFPVLKKLAARGGFEIEKTWMDQRKWFSLNLLKPIT